MSGTPSTTPPSRAREIFEAAADLPESHRSAYLDRACAGDALLRSRVEVLLNAMLDAGGFLDDPTSGGLPITISTRPTEGPGTRIGPYKLLQQIGEGGFGVV